MSHAKNTYSRRIRIVIFRNVFQWLKRNISKVKKKNVTRYNRIGLVRKFELIDNDEAIFINAYGIYQKKTDYFCHIYNFITNANL